MMMTTTMIVLARIMTLSKERERETKTSKVVLPLFHNLDIPLVM